MSNYLDEKLGKALGNDGIYEAGSGYSYISMASGVAVNIFATPVTIDRIIVNSASMPFTAYDNTAASGTVLATVGSADKPYTLLVGAKLVTGLTITGPAIAAPSLTIIYH